MGRSALSTTRRGRAVAFALAGAVAMMATIALVSARAADHLEAPIVAADLVSTEMSPVKPFNARGIVHLTRRPAGRRETITASFAGLVPNATYELALTRGSCRSMGDVHSFFDLGAELKLTAGDSGAIAVDKAMDLTRPNAQGIAKTAILRRAADDKAVACGSLLAFKRAAVTGG